MVNIKKEFWCSKKIGDYTDLSFLTVSNRLSLSNTLKDILLTDAERERMAFEFENTIEVKLKSLNQTMHDDLHIAVGDRVELIAAMIMAGLGVKDEEDNVIVSGLTTSDLKSDRGKKTHDGYAIFNRVLTIYKSTSRLCRRKLWLMLLSLKTMSYLKIVQHQHKTLMYSEKNLSTFCVEIFIFSKTTTDLSLFSVILRCCLRNSS